MGELDVHARDELVRQTDIALGCPADNDTIAILKSPGLNDMTFRGVDRWTVRLVDEFSLTMDSLSVPPTGQTGYVAISVPESFVS